MKVSLEKLSSSERQERGQAKGNSVAAPLLSSEAEAVHVSSRCFQPASWPSHLPALSPSRSIKSVVGSLNRKTLWLTTAMLGFLLFLSLIFLYLRHFFPHVSQLFFVRNYITYS